MIEPHLAVSTDEITAHPHPVGHRWFDLTMALSAICISIISLIVGVQHGHTERDLVEANSWPFIQVNKSFHADGSFELSLENAGVGPAKLESFGLLYKGQPVTGIEQLVQSCCSSQSEGQQGAMTKLAGHWMWSNPNQRVLRPGDVLTVFSFTAPPDSTAAQTRLRDTLQAIQFQSCYCSVFDKCFYGNLATLTPKPVAQCPAMSGTFGESD